MKLLTLPNNHDVLNSIWHDHHYPRYSSQPDSEWSHSQDIPNQETLWILERLEAFVEQVVQSDESAFVFEKSVNGLSLKKTNPLGYRFYELLTASQSEITRSIGTTTGYLMFSYLLSVLSDQPLSRLHDGCAYKKSNYAKIFCEIASRLQLKRIHFTRDPLKEVVPGLNEGEQANSFLTRLREACRRPDFKAALDARKNASAQAYREANDYIMGLQKQIPALYAIPLVLCYPIVRSISVTLVDSVRHIQRFLDQCHADRSLQAPVGWWWKRESFSEIGYRYSFFFFFDGHTTHYTARQLLSNYGWHWRNVTVNMTAAFIPSITIGKHPGEKWLDAEPDPKANIDSVLFWIACYCQRDNFLKLKKTDTDRHYGMGNPMTVIDNEWMPTQNQPLNEVKTNALSTKPLKNKQYPKIPYVSAYEIKRDSTRLKDIPFETEKSTELLERLEYFVNDALAIHELPFVPHLNYHNLKVYDANELGISHYPRLWQFVHLQELLSDRYEYSEPINSFRRCCRAMGLVQILNELPGLRHHWTRPEFTHALFDGRSAAELFNTLVLRIRQDWKLNNCQLRVNERQKEANNRYKEYSDYADALFDQHAKLMVLRIDLSYDKRFARHKSLFDMNRDLDHLLNNKRHNPLFNYQKGYITKIEFGFDKHIHCHLLLFFDGSQKQNSPVYFAQQIGEYWKTCITQGQGSYWNVNNNADQYKKRDCLGIGVIKHHETTFRTHLKEKVIHYLCKPDQLIRPKYSCKVRLFRRGNFPKIKSVKPGRPRQVNTNESLEQQKPIQRLDQRNIKSHSNKSDAKQRRIILADVNRVSP